MSDQPGPGVVELVGDPDRYAAWTLLVDGFPQSHVDLDDPRYLEFEYVRRLGHLVDLAAPAGEPLRVLHLGGGGLTLARYVAATRPGSRQLAVDCDAALVDVVRRRLPLDQPGRRASRTGAGRIRIQVADARAVLEQAAAGSLDLVVADLFAGGRTPAHLTSAEFTAAAARALAAPGVYAVNIGDGPPLAHARARVATVRSDFARACLIADPGVLRGRRFGNLVLAASQHDLPIAGLARRAAADPFAGRVVHGSKLDRFAAGARPISDADAEPSPAPPADLFAGVTSARRSRRPALSRRSARDAGRAPASAAMGAALRRAAIGLAGDRL
ncbi:MAG TPA: fused MFS/spermidine synthase [Streptosporangiaceae bacterium]|nr:fused MFS/spermidine synthase [Streptosporangiaceae bacterium]